MLLKTQRESEVLTAGDSRESIKMELDMDSQQMLMQMMSKNLYSDEIGSTIRELASNGLDSHRRAGVDKPIIVALKYENESYHFSVEDFGVGLDADDVTNIISKYGKSLARQEVNSLGMMGLGFKSPLAYTSSFYFIARKNGVERKYMMYEGEDGNKIDLLYEKRTTEENGVKVVVPVKYSDRGSFTEKIKEQLAYFESVYFDVPSNGIASGVGNSFTIFRGDDYQYSELTKDASLHLCLDNVYYPIDFQKLGVPRIEFPVALRFSLTDGIFPIPSRESLRYTPEAKAVILNKIGKIADFFVSKFNESMTETTNFQMIINYYNNTHRYLPVANRQLDIVPLSQYSTIPISKPTLAGIKLLDLEKIVNIKETLLGEYLIKYRYINHKIKEVKGSGDPISLPDFNANNTFYYLFSERIGGNKREYLRDLFGYESHYLIKKVKSYKLCLKGLSLLNTTGYYHILKLKKYPRDTWREMIKEYQYLVSLYTIQFKDVDKIEIPQSWLDARKRQRITASEEGGGRRVKLQGEIVAKVGCNLERSNGGRACKFVPETYRLESFYKLPYLHIYTEHDDFLKLDGLYHISDHSKIRCLTFSPREIKNLEKYEIHNLISYKKFMEGNNKPFKRLVTAHLIHELIEKYKSTFNVKYHLKTISESLHRKLIDLQDYRYKYFENENSRVYSAMLEVAKEHNLFDTQIYSAYLEIEGLLGNLVFIEPLMQTMDRGSYNSYSRSTPEDMIPILRDLFKYYKYRIDYTNYNITLNDNSWMEETLEDEPLTDEVVEALEEPEEELVDNNEDEV